MRLLVRTGGKRGDIGGATWARAQGGPCTGRIEVAGGRRLLRVALLVGAGSAVLRIVWAACAHVTQLSDFADYGELAEKWVQTGQFGAFGSAAYRTPGYPGFLALLRLVSGPDGAPLLVGMVQAVLGGVSSAMLVLLAGRVVSLSAATLAGCLHVVWPSSLAYVPVYASENVALPLLLASLLSVSAAHGLAGLKRARALALSGVLFGALLLVRPAAVFFAPAMVLVAALGAQRWRSRVGAPLLLLVGAAVVLQPWLIRNIRLGLGPMLTSVGGMNLYMGNNAAAVDGGYCQSVGRAHDQNSAERDQDADYRRKALRWIRGHPGRYLGLCWTRLIRLMGTESDVWAAIYLTPTKGNNAAMAAYFQAAQTDDQGALLVGLRVRSERVQVRNMRWLRAWRVAFVPFALVGLAVSFRDWRRFAPVVWPALSYAMGISLTFAHVRFRQLLDPLLLVPFAALAVTMIHAIRAEALTKD